MKIKFKHSELVAFNYLFKIVFHGAYFVDYKRVFALSNELGKRFLKKEIDNKAQYTISISLCEGMCLCFLIEKLLPVIQETSYEANVIREVYEQINKDLP